MSFRLPTFIYTRVLCTQHGIQIHVCQDLVHLDSSGPPSVSSWPLGSHPSSPRVVCVCVRIYAHTPTYTPIPVKIYIEYRQYLHVSSFKKWYPTPGKSDLHRLAETTHLRLPTPMNKLRIHERTCTTWEGVFAKNNVNWCQKHLYGVHAYTCTGAQNTCLVHTTPTAKNAHTHA